MTPQEQNQAIAEACGWKLKRQFTGEPSGVGVWLDTNGDLRSWTCIPNYFGDLNAMHEAEKVLTESWRYDYAADLGCVAHADLEGGDLSDLFVIAHATAAQRAEAFLRTIGKWRDE